MELSNTEPFLRLLHEMQTTVYQELQKTVHWSNLPAFEAICSDCHGPRR